jgi:two-component system sensor histidine kinase DesK
VSQDVSVNRDTRWIEWSGTGALLVFLLFLGFPLWDVFHSPPGAAHLALVLAGVALFVGAYLWLMRMRHTLSGRREWLTFGALMAVALALALDNSASWATLFIYAAAVCGFRMEPRPAVRGIVACAALAAATGAVGDYPLAGIVSQTVYAGAIGLMLLAFARLLQVNRELRAAREEIARLAVGEERLRFSRDLHDLLGHSLSVIALKSELAGRLLGAEPHRAAAEVAEIEQVTRQALQQVREAVTGYRRMTLSDELAGARMALSAAGIEAAVEQPGVSLPPEAEAILAWAVREGTTNVIRHSGARRCEIRVSAGLASADVEVVDDGRGRESDGGGSGLAGLSERVWRRQGQLEAGPQPDGGFRLRVSVPTT